MTDGPDNPADEPTRLAWRVGRHMLENCPAIEGWNIELLDMSPGAATLRMTITDGMANPFGVCHGGILFTLADTAFGFACNSRNQKAVGASCDMRYLQPAATGDVVIAAATEVWLKGRSSLYDVSLEREDGEPVALMRGYSRLVDDTVL